MNTFYIDTTSRWQIIAYKSTENFFESVVETKNNHYEILETHFQTFIERNNIVISEIKNIVVINGPGSFTGARIGVTFAQAFAFGLNANIYQISTFDFLEVNMPEASAILNARRERVFFDNHLAKISELPQDKTYVSYQDEFPIFPKNSKSCIPSFKAIDITNLLPTAITDIEVNYVKEVEAVEKWNVDNLTFLVQEGEYYIDSIQLATTDYTKNIVAKINGETVGCLVYASKENAEIYDLMVAKKYRHISIGTKLVEKALEISKQENHSKISLEVRESNKVAIAIYEKLNFGNVAKRKNYYKNPTEDAILMVKEL